MAILGIEGTLGSGKSYTAVWLALQERQAGRPVYANFPLAFGSEVRSWSELVALRDGVFVWDEVHLDLDSRASKAASDFTPWLTQTRKLGLDILYISQSFGQVDKRLRSLTDGLIRCTAIQSDSGRGTRLMIISLMPEPRKMSDSILAHDSRIYGLYDSYGLVRPLAGRPSLVG